jgi:hypothetical protein
MHGIPASSADCRSSEPLPAVPCRAGPTIRKTLAQPATKTPCPCAGGCDGIRAMPSARALLVASLLTEPPYGCLGPSGNDRYRKRSLRSQTVGASQVNCQSRGGSFAINRPPADVFGQPLFDDPPQ